MNDVDDNLLNRQQESEAWTLDDVELELTGSDNGSEQGAVATDFKLNIVDPEERALLDLLEMEEKSGVDSLLCADFLEYPTYSNTSHLGGSKSSWLLRPNSNKQSEKPSPDRASDAASSNWSLLENKRKKDGNSSSEGQSEFVGAGRSITLESLKKAVAGKDCFAYSVL